MAGKQGDWPVTKEQKCQWCETILHLTRKGTEPKYQKGFSVPIRGTGYYYTAEPHSCPEGRRVGKALKASQERLERALFGGSAKK